MEHRNQNGTIKKGTILNPKGRPKGVQNKTTKETKNLIQSFIENELNNIDELLDQLTPKERLDIVCKLLPYVLPKQTEIIKDEVEPITISIVEL